MINQIFDWEAEGIYDPWEGQTAQVIPFPVEATIKYLFDPFDMGGLEFKFGVIFHTCSSCFDKAVKTTDVKPGYDPFLEDRPLFICRG